jgi:hypothetical protein
MDLIPGFLPQEGIRTESSQDHEEKKKIMGGSFILYQLIIPIIIAQQSS